MEMLRHASIHYKREEKPTSFSPRRLLQQRNPSTITTMTTSTNPSVSFLLTFPFRSNNFRISQPNATIFDSPDSSPLQLPHTLFSRAPTSAHKSVSKLNECFFWGSVSKCGRRNPSASSLSPPRRTNVLHFPSLNP